MFENVLKHIIPPSEGNMFVYSRLKEVEFETKHVKGIGIKFGFSGEENYLVNHKEFPLQTNEYLLVNDRQDFAAHVSKNPASGLCIQVNNEVMNDVSRCLISKPDVLLEYGVEHNERTLYFINDINNASHSNTGRFLMQLKRFNYESETPVFQKDFFYRLAYYLVSENMQVQAQVNKLSARKKCTREELFRRIKKAKSIIDDCYLKDIQVDDIAREIDLSKFYFLQTYKKVYGMSPYQYLISKRLSHASHLLKYTGLSITEIASLSGYNDVYTFSKSFKKVFHVSPSSFR